MALNWNLDNRLPTLELREFVQQLQACMPALLQFLCSQELREHPLWGKILPFEVPRFGESRSQGHCIRPDIVLTDCGPRICEFDFVPSGRGHLLAALEDDKRRRQYLGAYSRWYRLMGVSTVAYATAATTTCWAETVLFSDAMREHTPIGIHAVNADAAPVHEVDLIDRLFYLSELEHPDHINGKPIITREPHLDSKLVFALIHDINMEQMLANAIGVYALLFLREVCPLTFSLDAIREHRPLLLEQILRNTQDWVIKNADVETNACWGCRGVVMGRKVSSGKFRKALLDGESPNNKFIGRRSVVQRFESSVDFAPIWDGIVDGLIASLNTQFADTEPHPSTQAHARKPVTARVGVYLLVANEAKEVIVPPFGVLTLRQDELVHGASDSHYTAFVIR